MVATHYCDYNLVRVALMQHYEEGLRPARPSTSGK